MRCTVLATTQTEQGRFRCCESSRRNLAIACAGLLSAAISLLLSACGYRADRSKNWDDNCNGTVGRYDSDPRIRAPNTAAFEKAYLKYYPQLGCPADNGGGVYVHSPCTGIDVQDFLQTDHGRAISRDGKSMLILNAELGQAFPLYDIADDDLWLAYACMQTPICQGGVGGLSVLGAPTSDRYAEGGTIRQNFERGWMSREGSGQKVTVHLSEGQALPQLDGCWPDGGVPWIDTTYDEAIDASIGQGSTSANVCAQAMTFDNPTPTNGASAAVPACELDQDGAVVLEYADLQCPASDRPYRGCTFMHDQDMLRFEPHAGGGGVYEIFFCIDGPLNGSVNLWYEQQGCSACRRYLPLVAGGEQAQGCRRTYVGPGDINLGAADGQNYCTDRFSGKAWCADAGVGGAPGQDAGATAASLGQDASGVEAAFPAANDDAAGFRSSTLTLMNEWCDPGRSAAPGTSPVKITLVSVVYHPAECLCRTDSDCHSGTPCRRVTWPANACCACDCPGFCQ
jgi:hypothetical protein